MVYTPACNIHFRMLPPPHSEQGSGGPQLQGTQMHRKQVHSSWRPTKRLLWHQIEHLRSLRQQDPKEWTHPKLAKQFGISVSAVTRILKSKCVSSRMTMTIECNDEMLYNTLLVSHQTVHNHKVPPLGNCVTVWCARLTRCYITELGMGMVILEHSI